MLTLYLFTSPVNDHGIRRTLPMLMSITQCNCACARDARSRKYNGHGADFVPKQPRQTKQLLMRRHHLDGSACKVSDYLEHKCNLPLIKSFLISKP